MARARTIKHGFFQNEVIAELSPWGRLLFIGLWTIADREGRLEYRPKRIKAQLFPYDEIDVSELIVTCHGKKLLFLYPAESPEFIQIVNFVEHQRPHPHEERSVIPSPEKITTSDKAVKCNDKSLNDTANCALPSSPSFTSQRDSAPANGSAEKTKPKTRIRCALPGFETFWTAYPTAEGRRVAKQQTLAVWRREKLEERSAEVLHGLERWKASKHWADGFVCQPKKFLKEIWENDPGPAAADQETGFVRREPSQEDLDFVNQENP